MAVPKKGSLMHPLPAKEELTLEVALRRLRNILLRTDYTPDVGARRRLGETPAGCIGCLALWDARERGPSLNTDSQTPLSQRPDVDLSQSGKGWCPEFLEVQLDKRRCRRLPGSHPHGRTNNSVLFCSVQFCSALFCTRCGSPMSKPGEEHKCRVRKTM